MEKSEKISESYLNNLKEIKTKAKKCVKQKSYAEAIALFEEILFLSDNVMNDSRVTGIEEFIHEYHISSLVEISVCYTNLKMWSDVISYSKMCVDVLGKFPAKDQTILLKMYRTSSRASMAIEEYDHAENTLTKFLAIKPDEAEIKTLLDECQKKKQETKKNVGSTDILNSPETFPLYLFDEFEMKITDVHIQKFEFASIKQNPNDPNSPIKGRGCIATETIEPGETILIDRGVAFKSDHIFEFVRRLTEDSDIMALYKELYPCEACPIVTSVTPQYKERINKLREHLDDDIRGNGFKPDAFDKTICESLIKKVVLNSFGSDDDEYMYPHLSWFNHSCAPSVMIFYRGDKCLVKTLRTIRKGEEICISYMDFNESRLLRNLKLKEHNFECECPRCVGKGEWREKNRMFEGFRCPECKSIISPDKSGDYACYKGCFKITKFKVEYKINDVSTTLDKLNPFEEKDDKEIIPEDLEESMRKILIEKKKIGELQSLERIVKYIEETFSTNHCLVTLALPALAYFYFKAGKKDLFEKTFERISGLANIFPSKRFYYHINELVEKIVIDSGEALEPRFINLFRNFGQKEDETKILFEGRINRRKKIGVV